MMKTLYSNNIENEKEYHGISKRSRQPLLDFYHTTNWLKRQRRTRLCQTEKAYAKSAKSLLGGQKAICFYGDAGRGYGSRIGGHTRGSHDVFIGKLSEKATVVSIDEYRSSKLCAFCHMPIIHPVKTNKDKSKKITNLGTVVCINPDCISRKNGYAARGRDENASINIAMIGYEQLAFCQTIQQFERSSLHAGGLKGKVTLV
ncbi:uncharacterized protein BX664DRAFT_207078 [Halteromyces radiatus]|uniref:uncharacterized protein n=1 Tax=Halteromyces radiatus TaxID=101107 RepID=UPI00221FE925|nr:uncharacterized protein BX664DRAFT_207078 [Halteromyces radiatus]KAI8080020.1 hypothetical protein BX664DRAFT_207078 [Halteromyces radiatus]